MTFLNPSASKTWKWKWIGEYLLIVNRQCSKMTFFRNECFLRWDLECLVKSNHIKSNQIILSNITYPIQRWIQSWFPSIWVSEGRSKQSSKHNSHFISFQFTYFSWLMCCHNFHNLWLFCDYLDYHLQEHIHYWMKWYVILEDLEWEMKMKMNNHYILSNTAIWQ